MAKEKKKISLLEKFGDVELVSNVDYIINPTITELDIPIVTMACSGNIEGGLTNGITELVGESRTFKTLLGMRMMKAYLDKYPESVAIFCDTEHGASAKYFKTVGIDMDRVVYKSPKHIEEFVFFLVEKLDMLEQNDKVFVFLDSLGILASKKEVENAKTQNEAADMSRAKAIRSAFRVLLPYFIERPAVFINHSYKTQEFISKTVVGGGTAATLVPDTIFEITRAQEKDKEGLKGWWFTLNILKSRTVKEKSKFSFYVDNMDGIAKYSGLFDIAVDAGIIIKVGKGTYALVSDGEIFTEEDVFRNEEFWKPILADSKFKDYVKVTYQLSGE